MSTTNKRIILVMGATGHQGQALIRSLLRPSDADFRVLALTRNAKSPAATRLQQRWPAPNLQLVEADLLDIDSVRRVFTNAASEGGVWGVFSVVAFPGLGQSADGVEKQGKNTADVAHEFNVECFIYSSAERGGEHHDDDESSMQPDGVAKVRVERHVKALGAKGLKWTIVRPAFFMENYEGFIGWLIAAVFKAGMKPTSTIPLIAVEDIGAVSAAVFRNPAKYRGQILALVGEVATMTEQDEVHKAVTGSALPSLPWLLASATLAMNKDTQKLIAHFEQIHTARQNNLCPEVAAQVAAAREAHPGMRTFRMWVEERMNGTAEVDERSGWNEISLVKLLMGRS
ncbi:NmrA-like family domain-containing protein 1 [Mycena kentingensis (nom. inval.)]|nr:NmrA-like family domain-containing protein 1 [Mycena kentingensis (nom. inval.)]